MRRIMTLAVVLFFIAGPARAKVDLATLPSRDTVQLTIYNSADLTLVRESRSLTVKEGANKLQFSWADTLIDPTSLEMLPNADSGQIRIDELIYPPRVKNLGLWNITSRRSGRLPVEISYLTSGLTWRAFYMGTLTEDEKTMRLTGYVRVTNNSGEDYENAQTRLIIGKVHIIDQIADLARRQYPYGKPGPRVVSKSAKGVEAAGVELRERFDYYFGEADLEALGRKQIKKEGLSEYFLYTIGGTETIPNGWSKRLLSFDADEVPVVNLYKFEQERYGNSVVRFLSFKNDAEHKLGDTPIPGGLLKVYRSVGEKGNLSYTGQSSFKYIPVDEDVELNLGPVVDVVVEPKLMDFKTAEYKFNRKGNITAWDEIRTFEVKVKNTRAIPAKIEIQRNFNIPSWEIEKNGDFDDFEKVDFDTVKFVLELDRRAEKQFTYLLTTHHETSQADLLRSDSADDAAIIQPPGGGPEIAVTQTGLQFDGDKVYAEVKDNSVLDLTGPLTLAAWIKFEPGGTENPRIISKGWEVRTGYELLLIGTGDRRRFQLAAQGIGRFDSQSQMPAGTWGHIAATYDGSTVTLFLNGTIDAKHKATGKVAVNDYVLNFGRNSQNFSDRYKGQIAEIRMWSRALSLEEIRQNLMTTHKSTSDLVGLWDFRQYTNAQIVPDISGHGNHARIVRGK